MMLSRTAEHSAINIERFVQNCSTLISLVAAGDKSAFTQLCDSTSGLLFGLLLRVLGHSKTAGEALEQVYEEIWTQASRFDEDNEKSLTWLITIAHRQGIAHLSAVTGKQFGTIHENNSDNCLPDQSNPNANSPAHARLVTSAINALSPVQREVLELTYFSGMKEYEIAEHLGQPLETVRLSLHLAIKKLSALFSFLDY